MLFREFPGCLSTERGYCYNRAFPVHVDTSVLSRLDFWVVDLDKTRPTKVVFRLLEPEAIADFASRKNSACAYGSLLTGASAKGSCSIGIFGEIQYVHSLPTKS